MQNLLQDEPERFEKLNKVLLVDLMSSEESDDDESFIVHPLSWRSQKYKNFIENLDEAGSNSISVKSKRMRSKRILGTISERPCPDLPSTLSWTIKQEVQTP